MAAAGSEGEGDAVGTLLRDDDGLIDAGRATGYRDWVEYTTRYIQWGLGG